MRPLPPMRITWLWGGALGAFGSLKSRSLSSGGFGPAVVLMAIFCFPVFGSITAFAFKSVTLVALWVVLSTDQDAKPAQAIGASKFMMGRVCTQSTRIWQFLLLAIALCSSGAGRKWEGFTVTTTSDSARSSLASM